MFNKLHKNTIRFVLATLILMWRSDISTVLLSSKHGWLTRCCSLYLSSLHLLCWQGITFWGCNMLLILSPLVELTVWYTNSVGNLCCHRQCCLNRTQTEMFKFISDNVFWWLQKSCSGLGLSQITCHIWPFIKSVTGPKMGKHLVLWLTSLNIVLFGKVYSKVRQKDIHYRLKVWEYPKLFQFLIEDKAR